MIFKIIQKIKMKIFIISEHTKDILVYEIIKGLIGEVDVCSDFEEELIEFDGETDHVHLLVTYPPKVAIYKLVNSLKGVSSRLIRRRKHSSIQKYLWGGQLWSPSYFSGSCGGGPLFL